jgi:DNA repair protein RecO (recombination protein O)
VSLNRRAPARAAAAGPLSAFVLHQYDWSESSLIVELFSRERGRLVVVAKGAKRPTSNFRAVLLPFHRLQAQLSRSPADAQSEIHALRGVELAGWQGGLPRSGQALFAGFYANELLLKLLPREDAHPLLFDHYEAMLPLLAEGSATQAALRAFELVLLRELGWLPDLQVDALTQAPLQPDERYELMPDAGLRLHVGESSRTLAGAQWLQLEAALAHGGYAPVAQAAAPVATALRVPLRTLVHYHLSAASLRTREVLHGVQALIER